MTITAKFNSICPKCKQQINAGEKVYWQKGKKAKHIECMSPKEKMDMRKKLIGEAIDKGLRDEELLKVVEEANTTYPMTEEESNQYVKSEDFKERQKWAWR